MLLESSVTSSRHNYRCTLGRAVKLKKSCCSPFAVVTKQNDPAAAAHLCFWRHCPIDLGKELSFQSPDFVHRYSSLDSLFSSSGLALAAGPCELAVGP